MTQIKAVAADGRQTGEVNASIKIGKVGAAACVAAVLAFGAAASAQQAMAPPEPFAFRGLSLGMNLADFEAVEPPVEDSSHARALCATLLDPEDEHRVVIRCGWVHRVAGARAVSSRILLGDIPARSYYLAFFGGRHGSPRLQQISISLPAAARSRAFRRLREKFGEPTATDVDDNLWLARWSNGISSVCLRSSVVDATTTVTFRLRPDC